MKRITRELREYRNAIDELGRAWKDPHYDRCGRCRTVSFMTLLRGDTGDIRLATRVVRNHIQSGEDYGTPKCDLESCVHHEILSFPVARRMLKIQRGEMGTGNWRGRKLGTFDLCRSSDEDPIGTVFLRFTRRKVTAHVWIEPPLEEAEHLHPLEAIAKGWDLHFKECREGCLGLFREARDLANADLELEPARSWELRAPFARR